MSERTKSPVHPQSDSHADSGVDAPGGSPPAGAALTAEVERLPADLRARLDAAGFDPARLAGFARSLRERGTAGADDRNRMRGVVEPPRPEDVVDPPAEGTPEHERLAEVGRGILARGELAFCVMAGGMATRMGGVVKALVEALDGRTFLELRLRENRTWSERAGRPVPLWLMTSEATEGPIREALARDHAGQNVATFRQDLGLRLTREGTVFRGDDGAPSTYSLGHGDLPDALRRSGLIARFVDGGGRYVWIANLDNLGATLDPALLGFFAQPPASRAATDVMVEVAPKEAGDKGGIPVWADAIDRADGGARTVRRLQVLEEFRLPRGFDATAVRVFNTNTFLVRADALLHKRVEWSWFEVEKKVDGRTAVQFERLLQELTSAMTAAYVRVPREGQGARFLPVKDHDELARRRDAIRAVALARGMI